MDGWFCQQQPHIMPWIAHGFPQRFSETQECGGHNCFSAPISNKNNPLHIIVVSDGATISTFSSEISTCTHYKVAATFAKIHRLLVSSNWKWHLQDLLTFQNPHLLWSGLIPLAIISRSTIHRLYFDELIQLGGRTLNTDYFTQTVFVARGQRLTRILQSLNKYELTPKS